MTDNSYSTQVKHNRTWVIAKYIISLGVICLGSLALMFLISLAKPPETQESTALIQQVDTAEIQPYVGLLDMVTTGVVVPHREIKLASEVGGKVIKKYPACESGNFVSKGERLVDIDPEEYKLDIRTLEAEVVQSEKRIDENLQQIAGEERNIALARVDLELQQKEMQRNSRLSGVLSQTEMDQSQRSLNSAQTQLTNRESNLATLKAGTGRLRAALKLSERQLDKATLNLRRTTIVAPDDGVIVKEMVQEGDYVSKGAQIATFEDTRLAEVLCNLTPSELKWIRTNAKPEQGRDGEKKNANSVYHLPKTDVTIFDPANPAITWRGVLERFDGIGRDEITKTIPCRIVVSKPIVSSEFGEQALVRGMYVKCRVEVQTSNTDISRDLISFPALALQPNNHIWTVRDSKLHRVDVEIVDRSETIVGDETKQIVVVRAAKDKLKAGDQIVTSPLSQPTEGAEIILKDHSPKNAPTLSGQEPAKPDAY